MGGVAEAGDLSPGEGVRATPSSGKTAAPEAVPVRVGRGTAGRLTVAATHPELLPLASCGLVAETVQ